MEPARVKMTFPKLQSSVSLNLTEISRPFSGPHGFLIQNIKYSYRCIFVLSLFQINSINFKVMKFITRLKCKVNIQHLKTTYEPLIHYIY